jgi:hypothetical protein
MMQKNRTWQAWGSPRWRNASFDRAFPRFYSFSRKLFANFPMTCSVQHGRNEQKGAKKMRNKALSVSVPLHLWSDLSFALMRSNDTRHVDEVIALAIKQYLAAHLARPNARGYQWKTLFLPEGTDLRMRYQGQWYYAKIEGDALMYAGESVSPREWTLLVTASIRNAWRDIWIRRNVTEGWTRACLWRDAPGKRIPGIDRRSMRRRSVD